MKDLEVMVLSGMRFGDAQRWATAILQVDESHFTDERQKLWSAFVKIYQKTGQPCTQPMFELSLSTMTNKALAKELQLAWCDLVTPPDEGQFLLALYKLEDQRLDRDFNTTVAQALEINARGMTIKGEFFEGRDAAKDFLLKNLPAIHSSNGSTLKDAVLEGDEVRAEYDRAKSGKSPGIKSYIETIDTQMWQMDPGDLLLLLGYTGEGKTQLCINFAHNNVVHGKNVLYVTTETVRERIRRRFWSRHSKEKQFDVSLPYSDIKHGTLSQRQEDQLSVIATDLVQGRQSGKYGAFFVVSGARGLRPLSDRIDEVKRLAGSIDLLIVDYLVLIAGSSERIDLADTVKEGKALAVSSQVPLITPWQTSLTAYQAAQKVGAYSKGSMAETSEAEKSSDFVLTLLRDKDDESRLLCKFTKVRDEPEGKPFDLSCDFAYSYIGDSKSNLGFVRNF